MDNNWAKDYPKSDSLTENTLDDNSSLKKMLQFIGTNKKVVDFGCATGYFAKFLHDRECIVTGVEINPEAAKIAEKYCQKVIVADLDFVSVTEILPQEKFDVAVFGDVLEHLRNPWKVLQETKQILKSDGFVVASIPNIAHGAIRLALLQGRFEYTELGILDNTHLRFFTKNTVEDLFEKSGYLLNDVDRTKLAIYSKSNLIPTINKQEFNPEILKEIDSEEDSDTLQFIVQAFPATLERQYIILKERYSHLIAEYQILKSQLQFTQTQLAQSQAQLQNTQNESQHYQAQLQNIQNELQHTQQQLLNTQNELQNTQAQLLNSQNESQHYQAQLQNIQNELQHTQKQLQHAQNVLEHTQNESQHYQAQLQHAQNESQHYQAQVQNYKSDLHHTQVELDRSHSDLQQTQVELQHLLERIRVIESSKFWKLRQLWIGFKRQIGLKPDE